MTKPCPYCAEEAKSSAKVCPHCRIWLTIYSLRNPAVAGVFACGFFLVLLVCLLSFMHGLFGAGRDFAPYRDSFSVLETHLNFQSDEYGPAFYVVVVVTNKSDLSWKNPQLDLRFFNQEGKLIDALAYTGNGTIHSHEEMGLRVKSRPVHPQNEYASCKVFVRSGSDSNLRF